MNEINHKLLERVKKYFPLDELGFGNPSPTSNGYIFDTKFCRVKFELSQVNYHPLYETIIYYGRLHAPSNEEQITWNGEKCLCWHSKIHITIPFIEGVTAQALANDSYGEIWRSLVSALKIDYPSTDYFEYPLVLHSKLWERYGERIFSVFDLRNPELWEKYSKYFTVYNEVLNKSLNLFREIDKIC